MAEAWDDASGSIGPQYDSLRGTISSGEQSVQNDFEPQGMSDIQGMMGDVWQGETMQPGKPMGMPSDFSSTLKDWNDQFATGNYDFEFGGVHHSGPTHTGKITQEQDVTQALEDLHNNKALSTAQDYLRQHGVIQ